jgi:hypothetical protein
VVEMGWRIEMEVEVGAVVFGGRGLGRGDGIVGHVGPGELHGTAKDGRERLMVRREEEESVVLGERRWEGRVSVHGRGG